MQTKTFLFILFSMLLAISEAAKTRADTKKEKEGKSSLNKVTSGRVGKPVDAKKLTKDPKVNPLATDPKQPVGTKDNPAAVHYDPKKQGDQTEILKKNPKLTEPMKLDTDPNRKKPADIRKDRYKEHGAAKPGQSKEDQPPASFGDKKGQLYNIDPKEQQPQSVAVNKANAAARKTDGYVQQVPYTGSAGKSPDPIPKKKDKREVLVKWLVARMLEEESGEFDALVSRSFLDEDSMMYGDSLEAREADVDSMFWEDESMLFGRDSYVYLEAY